MATFTTRPVIMGKRGVVTSGHYLASAAGFRIMEQGGNAVDAVYSGVVINASMRVAVTVTTSVQQSSTFVAKGPLDKQVSPVFRAC